MVEPRSVFGLLPVRRRQQLRRSLRRPTWGNLRRFEPLSASFGYDRGTPIDRHYLRAFLTAEANAIRGVAGEVSESRYVEEFGGERVQRVEVIDVDTSNPRATLLTDLAEPGSLPAAMFDCLVIVQTLQYTPSPEQAVAGCLQALRPGGTLLIAVPALAAHDRHEPLDGDFWRFWPAGVASLVRRAAPGARCSVSGFGNLVSALAFLHGISAEELSADELAHHDPRFPVLVCARADLPEENRMNPGDAMDGPH